MTRKPLLVIVSGAPGAGKSTLARALSAWLGLPLLDRDALKEAIGDDLGTPADVAASQRMGLAAYRILFLIATRILGAGSGVVIESNFRRGLAEDELRPLVELADTRLVHCTAASETIQRRYAERHQRGERHPVHLDVDRAPALADDLASGRFEPLDLDVPTMVVRTDLGDQPPIEDVVKFVLGRVAVGSGA